MRRKLTKRIAFWCLLAAFVVSAAWWCFYFPYDRERLYRAIPQEAVFVSEHEKLAERWDDFCRNPLTHVLFIASGLRPEEVKAVTDDPAVAQLIDKLASRDTVIAYAPSLGDTGRPAWVISSWLGGFGQAIRWGSHSGLIANADLRKIDLEGGRRAWLLDTGRSEKLSLAIVEGMLMGCYSEDPTAVRYLVDRVERGAPLRKDLQSHVDREIDDGGTDRGWFSASVKQAGARVPYSFRYSLNAHNAAGSAGRVIGVPGHARPPKDVKKQLTATIDSVKSLAGASPDMLIVAPFAYVKPFMSGPGVPEGLAMVGKALGDAMNDDAYMFACLFGGEMSGRILGLRVPSLIIGANVREESKSAAAVSALLDSLNARYGWSLIPRLAGEDANRVSVLDTGRGGLYASISPRERPAYVVRDGWFVLSSNMDVLLRWLGGRLVPGEESAEWRKASQAHESAAYAWVDLESTGQAVRNAIAVYSLALMTRSSPGSASTRRNLEEVKAWIKALAPLETCALWLGEYENEFDLRFKLGNPQ